jgi:muramoyltetrapeptide carboxypeptidase LdcA involved in peptidoglycan recycling
MKSIYPSKLQKGDEIRVIAPARNMNLLSQDTINGAVNRLQRE